MRTVALEEHFNVPSMLSRIPPQRILARGNPPPDRAPAFLAEVAKRLSDVSEARLADMDANGITTQVLSWAGPGADLLDGDDACQFATDANDALADVIDNNRKRFAGFAHLPVSATDAGAAELRRAVQKLGLKGGMVNGTTNGRFLDHACFEPLLAEAEGLGVPIYIHPNLPSLPVREAYYSDLSPELGFALSTFGFGWHAEVAVHVLRLVLNGTLNKHPRLKLIIGHMGEFLPMTLARTETMVGPLYKEFSSRTITEQLREQVWVTTSGLFTIPPLQTLVDTFGIDRVLFSVDYPYSTNSQGKHLIESLPFALADIEKICHGNADPLLSLVKP